MLLVVSLVSATIALLTVRCGLSPTLCVPSSFLATAVPLTVLDAKTRRLPNWLLGIGYGLLLAAAAAAGSASRDFVSPLRAVTGAAALTAFFVALYLLAGDDIGGGDVKLAGQLGFVLAWHGWPTLLVGTITGWALAAVGAAVVRARGSQGVVLPLAPYLVAGVIVALAGAP